MSTGNINSPSRVTTTRSKRPLVVSIIAIFLGLCTVGVIVGGMVYVVNSKLERMESLLTLLAAVLVAALGFVLVRGLWQLKDWARIAIIMIIGLGSLFFLIIPSIFGMASEIFAGEKR